MALFLPDYVIKHSEMSLSDYQIENKKGRQAFLFL